MSGRDNRGGRVDLILRLEHGVDVTVARRASYARAIAAPPTRKTSARVPRRFNSSDSSSKRLRIWSRSRRFIPGPGPMRSERRLASEKRGATRRWPLRATTGPRIRTTTASRTGSPRTPTAAAPSRRVARDAPPDPPARHPRVRHLFLAEVRRTAVQRTPSHHVVVRAGSHRGAALGTRGAHRLPPSRQRRSERPRPRSTAPRCKSTSGQTGTGRSHGSRTQRGPRHRRGPLFVAPTGFEPALPP